MARTERPLAVTVAAGVSLALGALLTIQALLWIPPRLLLDWAWRATRGGGGP